MFLRAFKQIALGKFQFGNNRRRFGKSDDGRNGKLQSSHALFNEQLFPFGVVLEKHEENAIVNIFKTYMLTRHADSNLRVFDFFRKVGLYPNLNGYAYLVEAIKCVTYNPELLRNLTKGLYPLVGKKFGVSGSVVERGIRNAVDSMMNKGKFQETANGLFGGNFGKYEKPTNGEFISFLSLM